MKSRKNSMFYNLNQFVLLLLAILFMLSSCGGKNLTLNDRKRIDSVSITTQNVKYSSDKNLIYLNTSGKAWASSLGGAIGAIIYESMDDHSPEAAIIQILDTDNMLRETVSESFKYQFENGGPFRIVSQEDASAYIEVEIMSLQFHELSGDDLTLTGGYAARLYDSKGGALLWENSDQYIAFNSDLIKYTLTEYISEPAKLRYAISVLSQMLAGDFVEDLNGQRIPVNHELHSVGSYHSAKL